MNRYKKKYTTAFTVLMVIVFIRSALRSSSVGNDTETYLYIYYSVSSISSIKELLNSNLTVTIESGYLLMNWLCSKLFSHYQSILVLSSMIIYWGYYNFCRKHSYSLLISFAIFFFLGFSDSCMNIIRQCIAIVITLHAYSTIVQKKKKNYLALIIVAFLFHKSAIIFLPAWWICKLNFNRKNCFISLVVSFALLVLLRTGSYFVLASMGNYANYMSDDYEYAAGGKIAPMINLIMYAVILWFSNRQIKMAEHRELSSELIEDMKRMRNLLWIATCLLVLSLANALISRMAMYYNIFVIALFANAIFISKNRFIWSLIIVLFMASYYLITVMIRPEWNLVYPYTFFWENIFFVR